MKPKLLLVVICFPLLCSGQTDTLQQFTLTPDQARSDFRLYRRLLQETHPGLYRYTPKEQMQRFLDSVDASFIKPIAFYDYQRLLALVNANIRCAHSSALPKCRYRGIPAINKDSSNVYSAGSEQIRHSLQWHR